MLARPSAPPIATAATADAPPAASPDWDPACYSTYSQIELFLQSQAAQYPHIETAKWHGIISGYGYGTFRPAEQALRGQPSKMLHIALTTGLPGRD